MRKMMFTSIVSLALLAIAVCNPLAAEKAQEDSPSREHINTVQALNYAAMSVYRVEKIPSKVTVAEEYAGIINNIAFGNINDDPELKRLIESMMDAYTEERLSETYRDLLRRQYEVLVNQAFLKVKPISHIKTEVAARNAEKMMMAMRADGLLGKLFAGSEAAGNALTEYTLALQENERVAMQARSDENEFMQQRMTQEWQLEKEKIRRFNGLHKDLINAAWSLLRRYNLPDKYRLTDENIEAYFKFLKEKDPATAVRLGERLEEKLAGYPPFWLYYGLAAQRNGKLDLARKCYENCEKFAGSILRTDHFLAAMAHYKIFVLGEKEVDEAKRLLGLIEKHSAADNWNNITFAAMQWYQLGDKAKADKLLQQNIDDKFNVPLHTELRRQLAAGKLDLAAVQGVAIREFKEPSQLEKLAQGGNAEAQYQLGMMCVENTSISEQNPGVKWLTKAAEQGHFFARCELAQKFRDKANRWSKDAVKLFGELEARKENDTVAMYYLGLFYGSGTGTERNPAKAFDYFGKAATNGLSIAQYVFGFCYFDGYGVAKNPEKAVEWFGKAAAQGNAGSQNILGGCYENGFGVAKDPAKAVEWYRKAAAQGHKDAQDALRRLGY